MSQEMILKALDLSLNWSRIRINLLRRLCRIPNFRKSKLSRKPLKRRQRKKKRIRKKLRD